MPGRSTPLGMRCLSTAHEVLFAVSNQDLRTPLWAKPPKDGRLSQMGSSTSLHTARYRFFRSRLRQARLLAQLTQEELAERVGRSQTWVSKCELGERRVDIVELEDLAAALSQPLDWFSTLGENLVDP